MLQILILIHRYIIHLIHSIYCKYVLSIFIFWYMFICSSVHLFISVEICWFLLCTPALAVDIAHSRGGLHETLHLRHLRSVVDTKLAHILHQRLSNSLNVFLTLTSAAAKDQHVTCWLRWCDLMRRKCFKLSVSLSVLSWLSILHLRPW